MRQVFKFTTQQERALDVAAERTVAMTNLRDGSVPPDNPVAVLWDNYGQEMGFDPNTVEFLKDGSFSAEVTR